MSLGVERMTSCVRPHTMHACLSAVHWSPRRSGWCVRTRSRTHAKQGTHQSITLFHLVPILAVLELQHSLAVLN